MATPDKRCDLENRLAELGEGLEIVAMRRLGDRDDARDAAQEVLARLLPQVREGRLGDATELARVAYGIARHVITDVLRLRRRDVELPAEPASPQAGALEQLMRDDDQRLVRRALAELSESDRELLRRCFVDGERIGNIAESLGEPAERLRKRKSRALSRLAERLRSLHVGPAGFAVPLEARSER